MYKMWLNRTHANDVRTLVVKETLNMCKHFIISKELKWHPNYSIMLLFI